MENIAYEYQARRWRSSREWGVALVSRYTGDVKDWIEVGLTPVQARRHAARRERERCFENDRYPDGSLPLR